ncbi:CorA family divalent cation transporter [Reyranella sp.]|uniref:CorA family divalent cation transporter n=1 Tax=Reyranella sp. TaxID=1929291 RepID=UPI003BAB1644
MSMTYPDSAAPMDPEPPPAAIPGLVWGFRILDDGTASPLPVGEPVGLSGEGWLWLHLDLADVRAVQWLRAADLPDSAVATMLSHDPHQQIHATERVVYGVLVDLVREIHGATDDVGHLHFIMTDRLLLTGRRHALTALEAARSTLAAGVARVPHCASLLELIVEHVADGVDEVAEELEAKLDDIEDHLAVRSIGVARRSLAGVRRASVRMHRHLSGLRAVLHRLERQGPRAVDPRLQLRVGHLVQRLDVLDHAVLEIRERGYRLQDEVSATLNEETNRHLHLLSILTSLLLPPTLVAGVFGMNTKGLPFTEESSGFLWAMFLVIGSSVGAYLLLRLVGILRPRD